MTFGPSFQLAPQIGLNLPIAVRRLLPTRCTVTKTDNRADSDEEEFAKGSNSSLEDRIGIPERWKGIRKKKRDDRNSRFDEI
jgi:hypothetical protein